MIATHERIPVNPECAFHSADERAGAGICAGLR
jgi:hypothetical protein